MVSAEPGSDEIPLRRLAELAGVRIGAALEPDLLEDEPSYTITASREFDALTPENVMKWGVVHPTPDRWAFEGADALVAFGEAHGMRVKGHTLVWHHQLPAYVHPGMTGGEMRAALTEHIGALVGRYRGRVGAWDVVNEAVRPDGKRLRGTVFEAVLGPAFVAEAFRLAHAADPDGLLIYNDYDAEEVNSKSDFIYGLLRELRGDGVPVHGLGLQMHVDAAHPPHPGRIRANVERFAALGLAVNISEMDVKAHTIGRDLARRLAAQRDVYHDLVSACLDVPGCDAITFWGFTDRHSWIGFGEGADGPLLFDRRYTPKPAYLGVADALRERGKRGPW